MRNFFKNGFLCALVLCLSAVPAPAFAAEGVTHLSLRQAVEMALKNNPEALIAQERVSESGARKLRAISALLPHLFGAVSEERIWKENLAALGFPEGGLIGPFNTFDARIEGAFTLFDANASELLRVGITEERIAALESEYAKEQLTAATALAYIDALKSFGELKAATADFSLARRLELEAQHQHDSGFATHVDLVRAQTRSADQSLKLQKARLDFFQSRLQLERVTGLPLGIRIRLSDSLNFFRENKIPSRDEAFEIARKNRLELQIADKKIRSSGQRLGAAKAELLPKVDVNGSYGLSGLSPSDAPVASQAGIEVKMPLFDGGGVQADIQESASRKRQQEIASNDTERNVEEDVFLAFRRFDIEGEAVVTAEKALSLAQQQLGLSKNRFSTGVSNNIELLTAQAELADARQAYISTLARYHMARVNLYASLGQTNLFYLEKAK